MAHLNEHQVITYMSDGFLVVRNVIPHLIIDAVIRDVEDEIEQQASSLFYETEIKESNTSAPFGQRWHLIWKNRRGDYPQVTGWHSCLFGEALFDLWTHPSIVDVVESLVGPEIQFNGEWWIRPELPAEKPGMPPWFQDCAYMPGGEDQKILAVWIPLVPVNQENGAPQFIPGSHLQGLVRHVPQRGGIFDVPVADPSKGKRVQILEMNPGDFVVYNSLTFHRSASNNSNGIRWSTDFRFSPMGTPVYDPWNGNMAFPVRSSSEGKVAKWSHIQKQWENTVKQRRIHS